MNEISSTNTPAVSSAACPRCKTALIDPGGLGWCKSCGYCKSLADSEKSAAAPEQAKSPAEMGSLTATGWAIGQLPLWFWVTLLGIFVVVGATFAVGRYVKVTPFERALLTSVQTGAAIGIILLGQFIGLMRIAPEDSTLGFFDALFPFRLYGLICKRLPATQLTLYLGIWGLAAAISVNVFVGGMAHWLTYLPNSKNPTQKTKVGKS